MNQLEKWIFDDEVAERFHEEAVNHIPSYFTVIEKSLDIAKLTCKHDDFIIDVGSATGLTIKKFIEAGFKNTIGVENSKSMIKYSCYPEKIIYSSVLPNNQYKLILMNWTLHFIHQKKEYLQNIYDNLAIDGYFILTEKTSQSNIVKKLYYNFKEKNNVSVEYILEKEKKLQSIMFCDTISFYLQTLSKIGFTVEILHADLGFVTFLCKK